jgi:hypothetical protein
MIRQLIPFLIIYVLVNGSNVRSYEGQSEETIQMLLAGEGRTGQFITEKEYIAFQEDHKPIELSVTDQAKTQAKIDLNTGIMTDTERIDAIIKYLELDK